MTLLRSRKIVLQEIANFINDRYFALFSRFEKGLITSGEARLIGGEIESLEEIASFIRNEAETINRDSAQEAADEILSIWQKGAR
ncbi:MAG: hypothetical protein LBP89_10405 [Helicobacteraceae bacterium]|jgi:hypothetical protein|nr:hypothetical protein [Helicobacteraceae bacterium]